MLREIEAAGRRTHSVFLDRELGVLFGYYETHDDEAARRCLAASTMAGRWEASMSRFFAGLDIWSDQAATTLEEVFDLKDQIAAAER